MFRSWLRVGCACGVMWLAVGCHHKEPGGTAGNSSTGGQSNPAIASSGAKVTKETPASTGQPSATQQPTGSKTTPADNAATITPPMNPHGSQTGVQPTQTPAASGQRVVGQLWSCDQTRVDFGTKWAGEQVKAVFPFKNIGDQVLEIKETKTKCGCTVLDAYAKQIPPGGTGQIPVTLGTDAKHGYVSQTVDVMLNDPALPKVVLELTGTVNPTFQTIPPDGARFGEVRKDQPLSRIVQLRNVTGKPLPLKMRPIQTYTIFDIQVKETEPGMAWEIAVKAKPPHPQQRWDTQIFFDTGFAPVPEYRVYASADVLERLRIVPTKIVQTEPRAVPEPRRIRIINTSDTPVQVTSIQTSEPRLDLRLLPPTRTTVGEELNVQIVLPANYKIPTYGELIRIKTSDPEYPLVEMYVVPDFNKIDTRPADKPLKMYPGTMADGMPSP